MSLSDSEKKQLAPYVIMKWLAGCDNMLQIILLNELVNPFVFQLQKHRDLLFMLLSTTTNGKKKRYQWRKNKSESTAPEKIKIELLTKYHGYSTREAKDVINLLSVEDYLKMADHLSYQNDEIKKIKKILL